MTTLKRQHTSAGTPNTRTAEILAQRPVQRPARIPETDASTDPYPILPPTRKAPTVVHPGYYYQAKPVPSAWPEADPVPEVLSTDPLPDMPIPRPVVLLVAMGEREGWTVRPGFSSSPERAVRVGTYKQTEAWGVWAGSHPISGWRWNAVYTRTVGRPWGWRSTALWLPGIRPRFTHASRTDLSGFIIARGVVGDGWFEEIKARERGKRARAAGKAGAREDTTR